MVLAGAVLIIAGAAVLGGYFVYAIAMSREPVLLKLGLAAIPAGILLLLLAVLRDRLKKRRQEDLKEEF
ncbi:MAG: hypothetical protein HY681_13865 [Chloroflexi bacterium]|nr:hypothetical protein [Chloroflexota bacterium]